MTEYEDEDIDEMVDEIFGDIDAGPRPPREYRLSCGRCGDIFTARTKGARFCPSCRQIVRHEAGRKGAEKAHGIKMQERIAAAHAGPRNDEAANAISPRHSEEADKADVGIRKTPPVTREALLDMAKAVVCGEREKQYGSPEDSFRAIADYWTVYLRQTGNLPEHRELTSEDAAIMMILLKVARQAGRGKLDNWVDIAGYAACDAEIAEG